MVVVFAAANASVVVEPIFVSSLFKRGFSDVVILISVVGELETAVGAESIVPYSDSSPADEEEGDSLLR